MAYQTSSFLRLLYNYRVDIKHGHYRRTHSLKARSGLGIVSYEGIFVKQLRICPKICHTGTITNADQNRTYRTITKANCQSSNLVYAITCNICEVPCIYVGKTKNSIVKRFGTHFNDIKQNHDTTVARHYNKHGAILDPPFQIHVLEYIHRHPDTQQGATILDEREKIWMARLNCYYPKGLNIQD